MLHSNWEVIRRRAIRHEVFKIRDKTQQQDFLLKVCKVAAICPAWSPDLYDHLEDLFHALAEAKSIELIEQFPKREECADVKRTDR